MILGLSGPSAARSSEANGSRSCGHKYTYSLKKPYLNLSQSTTEIVVTQNAGLSQENSAL